MPNWSRLRVINLIAAIFSLVILGAAVVRPPLQREDRSSLPKPIAIPTSTPHPNLRDPLTYLLPEPTSVRTDSDEPLLPGNLPGFVPTPTAGTTAAPTVDETATADGEVTTMVPACTAACVEIGVATEQFPGNWDALTGFSELSGRPLDIVAFFQAWGDADREFKPWLPRLAEMNLTPLITWEPWTRKEGNQQSAITLQSIVDGQHNAYIDAWAAQAVAYGAPIYIRFAHEMNTPPGIVYWYPWQGDPSLYVRAWQYVHDRFTAAGATNVLWVWSPAWMNDDALLYYPGPDYVDWVAVTVLNFGAAGSDAGWRSFEQLYNPQHSRAVRFGKPIMLSEVGSAEQGGDKGAWIASIGPSLEYNFPEIRALIWMNYSEARYVDVVNWRIDSSAEALAGWQQLMSYPYIAR
jgi:hypothetical protein